ncbi:MAG TPA: MFS transporter [Thermoleophilaceae bacterium]|nr:MFS transporter [Thermoleophilaceae bacterium]
MATEAKTEKTKLSGGQRSKLVLLGMPTFGLAFAATIVSTYLPVLINQLSGPALTGAMIGGEGLFGLFLPLLVGGWSDSVQTRFGSRMPFMLAAAPAIVIALVTMPLMHSIVPLGLLLALFYIGYFTYYAPYRALYPDVVPDELRARSQGVQKTWRELGLGGSLVGGGLLLSVSQSLPFVVAAVALVGVTFVFVRHASDPGKGDEEEAESPRELLRGVRRLVAEEPKIGWLLLSNSLWELTVAALKTFVVLYITIGLGKSTSMASAVLAVVAVSVVGGALTAGALGDRLPPPRLMLHASWVYGTAMLAPLFFRSGLLIIAVVPAAFAAGMIMALPYAELMGMLEDEHHGLAAGMFGLSRGVGTLLGPVLAGAAVTLLKGPLASTHGYAAVFGVASIAAFLSIFGVRHLTRETS